MSSLVSTLANVVKKTNSIVNETHLSIPAFSLSEGFEIDENLSLQGLVNSIKDSAGNVAQGVTIGICAFSMIYPYTNGIHALEQVFAGVAAELADVLDTIVSALEGQIELALQNTVGAVFAIIEAVLTLLDAIMKILDTIISLVSNFRKLGDLKVDQWWDDEECIATMASLAACYLNKILGPILDDFKKDVVADINSLGNGLQDKIKEKLGDGQEIRNYLNQESKLLQKANTQLRGLHNLLN